ncbi:hypothetical protein HYPSUDRAFT_209779 [Hypholoma sublateritium FD-334 SS-4]|uniref:Uncharacterized protein n=1 Tax=Hypholoma sublateritium (strain FD-334 SS-4) TaxID=945553 RepID=A0A0D2N1U8_HYPSF|nr:hypothetical protein HYPSUDRAFT_209779 [Hypholoma sublateritium FD-334 SS-4]
MDWRIYITSRSVRRCLYTPFRAPRERVSTRRCSARTDVAYRDPKRRSGRARFSGSTAQSRMPRSRLKHGRSDAEVQERSAATADILLEARPLQRQDNAAVTPDGAQRSRSRKAVAAAAADARSSEDLSALRTLLNLHAHLTFNLFAARFSLHIFASSPALLLMLPRHTQRQRLNRRSTGDAMREIQKLFSRLDGLQPFLGNALTQATDVPPEVLGSSCRSTSTDPPRQVPRHVHAIGQCLPLPPLIIDGQPRGDGKRQWETGLRRLFRGFRTSNKMDSTLACFCDRDAPRSPTDGRPLAAGKRHKKRHCVHWFPRGYFAVSKINSPAPRISTKTTATPPPRAVNSRNTCVVQQDLPLVLYRPLEYYPLYRLRCRPRALFVAHALEAPALFSTAFDRDDDDAQSPQDIAKRTSLWHRPCTALNLRAARLFRGSFAPRRAAASVPPDPADSGRFRAASLSLCATANAVALNVPSNARSTSAPHHASAPVVGYPLSRNVPSLRLPPCSRTPPPATAASSTPAPAPTAPLPRPRLLHPSLRVTSHASASPYLPTPLIHSGAALVTALHAARVARPATALPRPRNPRLLPPSPDLAHAMQRPIPSPRLSPALDHAHILGAASSPPPPRAE